MSDLLVNLYSLSEEDRVEQLRKQGIFVKRALAPDKSKILDFIREHFNRENWYGECEAAIFHDPVTCFIAVSDKKIVGVACYDATAKGYFGPIGTAPGQKGRGVGKALLLYALRSMREDGYGYAVIGWAAKDAMEFYNKCLDIYVIPDSECRQTVYQRMIDIDPAD